MCRNPFFCKNNQPNYPIMKRALILLSVLLSQYIYGQNIINRGNIWNLQTRNSVYQLRIDNGRIYPVYFGDISAASTDHTQDRIRPNAPHTLEEIPVRGSFADKMPVVEAVFPDGVRDIELRTDKISVQQIDDKEVLVIETSDRHYALAVTQYISVIPDCDMFEKWITVTNTSKSRKFNIKIDNLLSGSLYMTPDRYFLTHHSGQWLREFALRKTELTTGIKSLQSRDFMTFANTPWAMISTLDNPGVWYMQVQYSGNWRLDIEQTHNGSLQIVGGINFWDTTLDLNPGQSYTTPKMNFGYAPEGEQKATQLIHRYVRRFVMNPSTTDLLRPVLYNSWYATTFNIEENQQFDFAKTAKEIGIELFVIDDGWFKGRKNDRAGLGDWTVDTHKFPNGLSPMIGKINEIGLDFGIWVEPEMINENSDLYRQHPDWILEFPNRTKDTWRHQLTLNFAREDVYRYVYKSMRDLLANNNIKFIKWDRNRGLSQPGWSNVPIDKQREVRIRYVENLYRMIKELRAEFPDVIFENCSSGGGRPDLGMLAHMDQTWTSDQTDPIDRLYIQYGYLSCFPANTMVCWTASNDVHKAGITLEFSFDVAFQGVLGVGNNISRWSPEQRELAKRKIAQYKEIRHLIQHGIVSRLQSPFEGNRVAIQYTSESGDESVVLCYNLAEVIDGATPDAQQSRRLKLDSLLPDAIYQVGNSSFTGKYLMEIGMPWPLKGSYKSCVVNLKAK